MVANQEYLLWHDVVWNLWLRGQLEDVRIPRKLDIEPENKVKIQMRQFSNNFQIVFLGNAFLKWRIFEMHFMDFLQTFEQTFLMRTSKGKTMRCIVL